MSTEIEILEARINAAVAESKEAHSQAEDLEAQKIQTAWAEYYESLVPPSVSISSNVAEITEEGGAASLIVSLSKPWKKAIVCQLEFSGSASAKDYSASSDTVTIPPGQTIGIVEISAVSDTEIEDRESIVVRVSAVDEATLKNDSVTIWIVSEDVPPPNLELTLSQQEISESGTAVLTATLSYARSADTIVTLLYGGTAVRGEDYNSPDSILIKAGELSASVTLSSIEDGLNEAIETVSIIAGVSESYVGGPAVSLRIKDSPLPPVDPEAPPPVLSYDAVTIKSHPRLYWRNDAAARLGAATDLWKLIVTASNGSANTNRMLCRAIRYRLGETAYGPLAVADLTTLKIAPLSTHYDLTHLQPHAIAYDWLYDILTEAQRSDVRKAIYAALSTGSYWSGYNFPAGLGMVSALALEGDVKEGEGIPLGLSRKYWDECFWAIPAGDTGGLYNREYERNWQPGGGMREGWGYTPDQADGLVIRGAWESATDDKQSMDYPWMNKWSHLLLHQCRAPNMFSMPCYTYGNEAIYQGGVASLLQAGTGSRDPKTAALGAWVYQQNAKVFSTRTAAEQFIFRILIGDPTVKPQSPTELGLPLQYTTKGTGYVYDRSSWDDTTSTRVFFGCQWNLTRDFPMGDVMVASKGKILLGCRSMQYRHHYAPNFVRNIPLLYQGTTMLAPLDGDSTPRRTAICSLTKDGDWWVADLTALYAKYKVERLARSWKFDPNSLTIAVVDEFRGPTGITPRFSWNTPLRPIIGGDNDGIAFTNGEAACMMTFDTKPTEILLRGGETDFLWAEDYSGAIDAQAKNDLTLSFSKLLPASQINAGGYYTAYVTPSLGANGTYKLTTTIEVK